MNYIIIIIIIIIIVVVIFETTAKQAEWRPRRDQDGKNTSLGILCACLIVQIYFQ